MITQSSFFGIGRTFRSVIFTLLMVFITLALITLNDSEQDISPSISRSNQSLIDQKKIAAAFYDLPIRFEANKGQVDSPVDFLSHGKGYDLYLSASEAVLALANPQGDKKSEREDSKSNRVVQKEMNYAEPSVLKMKLVDSNPAPKVVGLMELSGKSNYFIGNDPSKWRTDVPNYQQVKYCDVYPGVDLVYYGNQGKLEYDFIVAPNADPQQIKLSLQGVDRAKVNAQGDLMLQTADGELCFQKPLVYQEVGGVRQELGGRYKLQGEQQVGFQVAAYDASIPLIIDPVLSYSTYLGGSGEDSGIGIAVNAAGNVYVTGSTSSPNFPEANPFQSALKGQTDVFITKLNTTGTALVYSTYLGGNLNETGSSIAIDAQGDAYVIGTTNSPNFPLASPIQGALAGSGDYTDAFVTKLNSNGSLLIYSTYLGGYKEDDGIGIAVDASGNAYLTGITQSYDYLDTPEYEGFPLARPIQKEYGGVEDVFVAKLNAAGTSLVYSTYLGGNDGDTGQSITVDASGNAYITGITQSMDDPSTLENEGFPLVNPIQQNPGGVNAFVAKIGTEGSTLVYSSYLGGSSIDAGAGIAVDNSGNAYVTGYSYSNDFPTESAFRSTNQGRMDAFITKLNPVGSAFVYSTYLGGSGDDAGYKIAVDSLGNAYVTGITTSTSFPMQDALQVTNQGNMDAFVAKLNPAGSVLVYSTYLGGSGSDLSVNIAVDNAGNAYVTGQTNSTDFPTMNPFQQVNLGAKDIFIAKIAPAQPIPEVGVWQDLKLSSSGAFKTNPESNVVTFDGHRAKVLEASEDTLFVLVPYELVENRDRIDIIPDTTKREVTVVVKVVQTAGDTIKVLEIKVIFVPPKLLIHDEVTRAEPPIQQDVMWQKGWAGTRAFAFFGYGTDGWAAVRVTNTSTGFPPPISLLIQVAKPSDREFQIPSYGNLPNVGIQNAGTQFLINETGWYIILVTAGPLRGIIPELPDSPGPFPAQFQIHLAGNVGLPMMLGRDTWPRGTRLDTYFNHPAPKPENLQNAALVPGSERYAETGLFKFANPVSVSRYPIAMLIPPTVLGFPIGTAPVRAAPPAVMGQLPNLRIDITVPNATTPGAANPVPGTVIDLAQVPIPASVLAPGPPQGVARILGAPDGSGVTLPMNGISSLIVDMGSGNEIVNGSGSDFRVIALSGTYSVAVSNTPFSDTFKPVGTVTGQADLDIASTGLTSARYVRILVDSGTATIDAVQSLHFFSDQMHPTIGPLSDVGYATITARRQKLATNSLDPLLELISTDGSFLGKNESGFGDDTETDRSDAALIKMDLNREGFYRFLCRGYDTQPDGQSFGRLFARLETAGEYDPVELKISTSNENQTVAQKTGTISEPRQRDSYLFQAAPGTIISIVVNGIGSSPLPDPLVELYDPEDFLIAANDNFDIPQRGRNSALTVTLDPTARFPNPSTYRIVVMGIDGESPPPVAVENGTAHIRRVDGGNYELKVFTGAMAVRPAVVSVSPNKAVQGTSNLEMTINGNNFVNGATVTFSGTGVTVKAVNFISSSQLKATVDIAQTASIGMRDVFITNPDGQSGTGNGVFEVRASLGTAVLNWDAPVTGGIAPPTNLTAQYSGGGLAAGSGDARLGRRFVLPGVERKQPSFATQGEPSLADVLTSNLDEVEPNNYSDEAQVLTGNSPLVVNGNAEVDDSGGIIFTGFYRSETDDIEDLFLVTTTAPGLKVNLTGFTSDCDLYLMPAANIFQITASATIGANTAEEINQTDLAEDVYLVGVSIFDPDPLGALATPYILTLTGQFQGGGAANLQSYHVYRSTSLDARNSGTRVGEVNAGTQTFTDPLPHTGNFFYQVTAVYDQGESAPSNEATISVTRVEDGQPVNLPVNFELGQNYPNPFNPTTVIEYQLPKASNVEICIFDLQGKRVITLVMKHQAAGFHEIIWDGLDESGQLVASGIYLYRLDAGGFVVTKKMLLLR